MTWLAEGVVLGMFVGAVVLIWYAGLVRGGETGILTWSEHQTALLRNTSTTPDRIGNPKNSV